MTQEQDSRDPHRKAIEGYMSPKVLKLIDEARLPKPPVLLDQVSCLILCRNGMFSVFDNPQEESLFLNSFFKQAEPILHRYEGVIEDVNSQDATKVDFGILIARPDHSLRAVCTALELQEVLKEYRMVRSDINMNIGINSGEVAYGNVGSPERLDFGIWGDNVRIAYFLADHAASVRHDIVIGEGTWQQLPEGVFVAGDPEEIAVQNKIILARRLEGFAPGVDPLSITEPLVVKHFSIS